MPDFKPPSLDSIQPQGFRPPSLDSLEAEEKPIPGYLETLGSDLKALPGAAYQAIRHPGLTANAIGADSAAHLQNAHAAFKAGDYEEALNHIARAVPVIGNLVKDAEADNYAGNTGRALARITELAAPEIAGEIPSLLARAPETAAVTGAALRAGLPGVGRGVLKAGAGAVADEAGLPYHVGALWGAKQGIPDAIAGVKAGVQAGKDAASKFRIAQEAAARGPRPIPAWQAIQPEVRPVPGQPVPLPSVLPSGRVPGGPQNIPAPVPLPARVPAWQRLKQSMEVAPVADTPVEIPNALPSGRVPGGVHNQELPVEQQLAPPGASRAPAALPSPVDKFRELQKSAKAAKAPEPSTADQLLDGIAQGYGFKKGFKAVKDPAVQQTIRDLAAKVGQAKPEAPIVAPEPQSTDIYGYDPAKDPSPFGQDLAKAFARLREKGPLLTDPGPNEGPYRFEEGNEEAPVIDSSKTRGNRPVANPSLLKPGQPEAMVDTLQKIANPTEGQKALLKQLREEIKRRGTQ